MSYKDLKKQKKAQHESYLRHRPSVISRSNRRRLINKKWFQEEVKTQYSCVHCGEDDPICLDFHHRDPKTKENTVGSLVAHNRGKKRILEEIAKCVVFCSNCHRKFHAGRFQLV